MPAGRPIGRWIRRCAAVAVAALVLAPTGASAQVPSPPFAAVQYGTNGCLEIGVRPDAPYNQPKPYKVPDGYDVVADGYPAFGYDTTGFTQTSGTNACRYNFRDDAGATIGSGYCVQWAKGQRSTTGYDPEPWDGSIRNQGYVQWILEHYWPAADLPAVPATVAKTVNAQRGGTVAMAIHFFTDGIVMPPKYQVPALYDVVGSIVQDALDNGPSPTPPADPRPTIEGPAGAPAGVPVGPYTIGANASGSVSVQVTGAQAFTDAAATTPFTGSLPPGGQLWLVPDAGSAWVELHASGPVVSAIGTFMVGDPTYRVQSMMLAGALTLLGKSSVTVAVAPAGDPPSVSSRISASLVEAGADVFDRVDVAHLTGTGTLTAVLYGPVDPVGGAGCPGADWTAAPVLVVFDPVTVTSQLGITTLSADLGPPGCYSFGLTLHPDVAGADVVLPPGDPDETVLVVPHAVVPPYDVSSQASANTVAPGAQVTDTVTLSGLLTDRAMVMISALFGPVPPDSAGSCAGVDWVGLQTAEALPLVTGFPPTTLAGDGAYTTPPVTLAQAGCYSFGETMTTDLLTGGEEPVLLSIGDPAEVVLVRAITDPVVAADVLVATGSRPGPLVGWAVLLLLAGGALVAVGRSHGATR